MFSGSIIPRPIITHLLEFKWITAKLSNIENVRISSCHTEMLWVELIMFFQPERNTKQSKNRKNKKRNMSGA